MNKDDAYASKAAYVFLKQWVYDGDRDAKMEEALTKVIKDALVKGRMQGRVR